MPNPIAVLVEDDPEQFEVTAGILTGGGFEVRGHQSMQAAAEALEANTDVVDLFVLDRRLPMLPAEVATDEVGDELLRRVRSEYPDARLIVFTGYASIRQMQQAMGGGGLLPANGSPAIDRVSVLEKSQTLEFRKQVVEYRELLQQLENIEIRSSMLHEMQPREKRILRRVAFEYRAISIEPTDLGGGLTGVAVWRCELTRLEGSVGTVVVKQSKKTIEPGGLPELLRRASVTTTVGTISGLMDGTLLTVLQVAAAKPVSLMSLLQSDPDLAAASVKDLLVELAGVGERDTTVTIASICGPLISWEDVASRAREFGIDVPSGDLVATTRIGMRHGDLHPGNILLDDGKPVLIDFDSSEFGSGLIDPITLALSTLVHPASPIRGERWPGREEIRAEFGRPDFAGTHSHNAWFATAFGWAELRRASEREYWALVLAYCIRQLGFDDVVSEDAVRERVIEIARLAAINLQSS
ncbi:CheY-like chemotaxis protein [Agromyces terreus]|uniref:CheY-like chemotaxis protein n=1 Tax=Agromyces terreus TaxID=424795 RepID=A0A9X2GYG2_9MICO|nr:response regulator [Agromyces terreus]MCP2369643.1 CheY-like chemotaxis protein [Agromyces terreus]